MKIFVYTTLCAMVLFLIYFVGRIDGKDAERERQRALVECYCGEYKSCVFGPGVVGVKRCDVAREWGPCEPDPKYRVEGGP